MAPDETERQAALDGGYDLEAVLSTDDLVRGDNCFFAATGITDGELLHGVRYNETGAVTQSLVMRSKSGTVRLISASHPLQKLAGYSAIEFSSAPARTGLPPGRNRSRPLFSRTRRAVASSAPRTPRRPTTPSWCIWASWASSWTVLLPTAGGRRPHRGRGHPTG